MSKRTRGTTKDANRRRERHSRSEWVRRERIEAFAFLASSTFGGPCDRLSVVTLSDIARTCKAFGAADVRIREWLGGVVVIPLGVRGRPAHPAITQRVRAELLARKPLGVEMVVLWKDDGLRGRALAVHHARVYSDGTTVLPDCAVMTRLY